MWIEDILKALWVLDDRYSICVDKIENGIIFFSDHTFKRIKDLVAEYNKEYT